MGGGGIEAVRQAAQLYREFEKHGDRVAGRTARELEQVVQRLGRASGRRNGDSGPDRPANLQGGSIAKRRAPAESAEGYMTLAQYAAHAGVTPQAISYAIKHGKIARGRNGIHVETADRMWAARRKGGMVERSIGRPSPAPPDTDRESEAVTSGRGRVARRVPAPASRSEHIFYDERGQRRCLTHEGANCSEGST